MTSDVTTQNLNQEMVDRFQEVAPHFFEDRSKCIVILPQDAYHLFFDWVHRNHQEFIEDDPIYDGFSTFPENYFGVRITDKPEVLERVLSETGIFANRIPFIIAHHPSRQVLKGQNKDAREIAYDPK